jgi:uncharacterized protein YoxC
MSSYKQYPSYDYYKIESKIDSLEQNLKLLINTVAQLQQFQGELLRRVEEVEDTAYKTYQLVNKLFNTIKTYLESISKSIEKMRTEQIHFQQSYIQKLEESRKDISQRVKSIGEEILQQVNDQIIKLDDSKKELIKQIKETSSGVVTKLNEVLREYEVTLKDIKSRVEVITPKIDGMRDELKKPILGELKSILDSILDTKQSIRAGMDMLKESLEELKDKILKLQEYDTFLSNEEKILLEERFEQILSNLLAAERDLNGIISLIEEVK